LLDRGGYPYDAAAPSPRALTSLAELAPLM